MADDGRNRLSTDGNESNLENKLARSINIYVVDEDGVSSRENEKKDLEYIWQILTHFSAHETALTASPSHVCLFVLASKMFSSMPIVRTNRTKLSNTSSVSCKSSASFSSLDRTCQYQCLISITWSMLISH